MEDGRRAGRSVIKARWLTRDGEREESIGICIHFREQRERADRFTHSHEYVWPTVQLSTVITFNNNAPLQATKILSIRGCGMMARNDGDKIIRQTRISGMNRMAITGKKGKANFPSCRKRRGDALRGRRGSDDASRVSRRANSARAEATAL